ncbi:MAG: hypothetical protein LBK47_08120 [Prevotellaceae bacterium]|jgi:hypothetical protein|nr:hypothetical protein [Prevotellaceae bacterium]
MYGIYWYFIPFGIHPNYLHCALWRIVEVKAAYATPAGGVVVYRVAQGALLKKSKNVTFFSSYKNSCLQAQPAFIE